MRYIVSARKQNKALIWEHPTRRSAMARVRSLMMLHNMREEPQPTVNGESTIYELDLRPFYSKKGA